MEGLIRSGLELQN